MKRAKKRDNRRIIELSKRVMHDIAFNPGHHGIPQVKHEDGSYHVVGIIYDDTLESLWERVRRSGDTCNIYVQDPAGGVHFFRVTQQLPEGTHVASKDDSAPWWGAKTDIVGQLLPHLIRLRDDEVLYRADATGHGLGYLSRAQIFLPAENV